MKIMVLFQLKVLAKTLEACQLCGITMPLHLKTCTGEKWYMDLGGFLIINCTNCCLSDDVPLGTRHGKGAWDINAKLASGKSVFYNPGLCSGYVPQNMCR